MTIETRYAKLLKELNIPDDRYEHIVLYVTRMIIDYQGKIPDIIKEIPLNLKGNERYFTMFIVGNSSTPSFSNATEKEKEKFITNITNAMNLSEDKVMQITRFMADTMLGDIGEKHIPIIDIIKKVINSNFTDREKDYIIFMLGLILTSDIDM